MEKPIAQRRLLRVTQPQLFHLSFCEPTVRELQIWLDALPRANVGETARQLYQALVELNRLVTEPENRLLLLERIRPEVYRVCQQMERHFFNQPVVLGERARKVANLCQALQSHLAIGYKLIVLQAPLPPSKAGTLLNVALQRAMHSLRAMLIRSCQLYGTVPEGVWLELHQLYLIACQSELAQLPVEDALVVPMQTLSVERTYISALLLGCARTNQIRQNSIGVIAQGLDLFSALVTLQSVEQAHSLFAWAPQLDAPPRYSVLCPAEPGVALLGMDTRRLTHAIADALQMDAAARKINETPLPVGFSAELLKHVQFAWGEIAERSFERLSGRDDVSVCIGMSAVHYFVAGKRSFVDVLRLQARDSLAVFKPAPGAKDIWAGAFDAAQGANDAIPFGEITFEAAAGGDQSDDESDHYPIYDLRILNHSPGGYCLSWQGEVPVQLQAGELLGIRDETSKNWSLAAVRWIRQALDGALVGAELLAPNAEPCGVQLLRKGAQGSEFLRGFMVPPLAVISRPASVITPRLPFQEGSKIIINHAGQESRALLTRKQFGTAGFSQFEYGVLDSLASAGTPVTSSPPKKAGEDEDFDSLWNSL